MRIGILGTGTVGSTIGTKLAQLGHDVKMGSRSAANEKATTWARAAGAKASTGTFADAAAFGELLFNCVSGVGTLEALKAAGAANLKGKILIDISNPLDFSKGFPPSLTVANTDSLAEQIQRAFPELRVVKSLNTLTAPLMVDPKALAGGDHTIFVAGNDADAKGRVTAFLKEQFGWKDVFDVGDITASRGLEGWLLLWVRMYGALQKPMFNLKVVR